MYSTTSPKKIVIFGGGTGLSCILSGLKQFPLDVTAVITVSDDGSSTGVLKEELDIPAVGDIGKVLLAMANVDEDFVRLLRYRFQKDGSLHNHPVRNVLLAALIDIKGNLTEATNYMCQLLNIRGTVLPLTEDKVDLIGYGQETCYVGEREVSQNAEDIYHLAYDHKIKVNKDIIEKIKEADLLVLSPGSLYTSILPHLIVPSIKEAMENSSAPIMYISNLVTQPGETDNYTVSDHIRVLNDNLGTRKVNIVVANSGQVNMNVSDIYKAENKDMVILDYDKVEELQAEVIANDIIRIDQGSIRHNEMKTAYLVFSYFMK